VGAGTIVPLIVIAIWMEAINPPMIVPGPIDLPPGSSVGIYPQKPKPHDESSVGKVYELPDGGTAFPPKGAEFEPHLMKNPALKLPQTVLGIFLLWEACWRINARRASRV
jgi:hypothetical protein